MSKILQRSLIFIAILLGLISTTASAVSITGVYGRYRWSHDSGIVASSDKISVSRLQTLTSDDTRYKTWALVLVTNNSQDYATHLPVALTDNYQFSITGRITLTDNGLNGESMTWASDDPFTESSTVISAYGKTATVLAYVTLPQSDTRRLSVSGYFQAFTTCTTVPCQRMESFTAPSIDMKLVPVTSGTDLTTYSVASVLTGEYVPVKAACGIDITPTTINFGTVKPISRGAMLAQASTRVKAYCGAAAYGSTNKLTVYLSPQDPSTTDDTLALMSVDGLGVRYTIGSTSATCSRTSALDYFVKRTLGTATVTRSRDFWWDPWEYTAGTADNKINWALCQTADRVPPGSFTGAIDYVLTLD